jgi:hypothetical protein
MPCWPPPDRESVYVPPESSWRGMHGRGRDDPERERGPSETEQRALLAAARVREGLPISDEILDRIMRGQEQDSDIYARAECSDIYTRAERSDIDSDRERVERVRALLNDDHGIYGGITVCRANGQRAVRATTDRCSESRSARIG